MIATPNLSFEKKIWKSGLFLVAGMDEAGRGALAGPVAVGAVILPNNPRLSSTLRGVRDSKQMTAYDMHNVIYALVDKEIGRASCRERV